MVNKSVLKADWLMLLAAVIWGGAFVAQRMGMAHVGPLTFTGVRFALGSLVLLPLALRPGKDARVKSGLPRLVASRPTLWGGLMAGAILFGGAVLQQIGLVHTTAGKAGFVTGLYVVIVPLLGLLLGHRVGLGGWLGTALAVVGLYLLSFTERFSLAPGDLWVLVGAFFWAGHVLVLGWLSPRVNVVRLACAQFAACSLFSLIGAALTEEIALAGIIAAGIPILYGGLISVGVAYTLQVVAQRDSPPHHAAIILSMEAVFAVLAGFLLLGETLTARSAAGCGLMLAGMLLVQLWPAGEAVAPRDDGQPAQA